MVLGGFLAGLLPLLFALPVVPQRIPLPARPIEANGFLFAQGACVEFASDQLGFVALSTDDAATFRYLPLMETQVYYADFTCFGGQFFTLVQSNRVFRAGASGWTLVSEPPKSSVNTFRGFVRAGNTLYVGAGSGIIASRDRGQSFVPVLDGVNALASDETLVLGAKGRELYAIDAGDQLTLLARLPKPVRALGFAAGHWFATLEDGVLYRSDDQGKSWTREVGAPANVRRVSAQGEILLADLDYRAWSRDAKGKWRQIEEFFRVVPAPSGYWIMAGGGPVLRAPALTGPRTHLTLPQNPMPSVRLLAAQGTSIVLVLNDPLDLMASKDAGHAWSFTCSKDAYFFGDAALDADRLQLSVNLSHLAACKIPGFKTRQVRVLPAETCNGDLCVRFRDNTLLRTLDRGKTWQALPGQLQGWEPIVAAAAAGHEILVARGRKRGPLDIQTYDSVLRSTDDGKTFVPFSLPTAITAFAPSDRGWLVGTLMQGLFLVPFSSPTTAAASARPAP
jgi:hypothetical protein